MKEKKEQPAPQDAELFRQALDGVTPLPPSDRHLHPPSPRKPVPRSPAPLPDDASDPLSDHDAGDAPPAEFLRPGVARMTLRKLRRGQFPLQDSFDLHGLNSDEARKRLPEFLRMARERGLRCVCVIHGKGRRADGSDGVLKTRARRWLPQCAEVLAFCEAPPGLGGGGAVLVLLKAPEAA